MLCFMRVQKLARPLKVTVLYPLQLSRQPQNAGSISSAATWYTMHHGLRTSTFQMHYYTQESSIFISVVFFFFACLFVSAIQPLNPFLCLYSYPALGSSTAMINPVIYGVFHLRRPRSSKLQQSTIVLSSSFGRHPLHRTTTAHIRSNQQLSCGSNLKQSSSARNPQTTDMPR